MVSHSYSSIAMEFRIWKRKSSNNNNDDREDEKENRKLKSKKEIEWTRSWMRNRETEKERTLEIAYRRVWQNIDNIRVYLHKNWNVETVWELDLVDICFAQNSHQVIRHPEWNDIFFCSLYRSHILCLAGCYWQQRNFFLYQSSQQLLKLLPTIQNVTYCDI